MAGFISKGVTTGEWKFVQPTLQDFVIQTASMAQMGLWLGPLLNVFQMPLGVTKAGSRLEAMFSKHTMSNMVKGIFSRGSIKLASSGRVVSRTAILAERNLYGKAGQGSIDKILGNKIVSTIEGPAFVSFTLAGVEEGAYLFLDNVMGMEGDSEVGEREVSKARGLARNVAFASLFFLPAPSSLKANAKTIDRIAKAAAAEKQAVEGKEGRTALDEIFNPSSEKTLKKVSERAAILEGETETQLRDVLSEQALAEFKGYERTPVREIAESLKKRVLSEDPRNVEALAKAKEADNEKLLEAIQEVRLPAGSILGKIKVSQVKDAAVREFVRQEINKMSLSDVINKAKEADTKASETKDSKVKIGDLE